MCIYFSFFPSTILIYHNMTIFQDDHTPYCEVPDATFSQLLSHPLSDKVKE